MAEEKKKDRKQTLREEEENIASSITEKYLESQRLINNNLTAEQKKKDKRDLIKYFIFLVITVAFVIAYQLLGSFLPDGNEMKTLIFDTSDANRFNWVAKICSSFYILMVVEGVAYLVRLIMTISTRKSSKKTITVIRMLSSAIKYVAAIAVILAVMTVWGVDTTTLIASAGILALIIGLGAQTLIADIIAGIELVFENQFEVGDMVVIDSFRGEVVEIGLSCVKIIDWANNIKVIRNNQITTVVNLSRFPSAAIADIYLDHDADLQKVREIIEKDLETIQTLNQNILEKPSYLGVNEITTYGINVRVFMSCPEGERFGLTRWANEHFYVLMKENGFKVPPYEVRVAEKGK